MATAAAIRNGWPAKASFAEELSGAQKGDDRFLALTAGLNALAFLKVLSLHLGYRVNPGCR